MIDGLIAKVREFGLRAAPLVEGLDEDRAARKALDLLAGADLLGWTIPESRGGAANNGLSSADAISVRALCALRDELAWHSGMLDVMFVMQGLGSCPIVLGASDELCAAILPDVARGKQVAAFAVTEEGAGSSLGEANLRAAESGGRWRLNGAKTFISNAGIAGFYSVLARTAGEPGDGGKNAHTMFYVPATTKGLEVKRFEVMAPHPIGEVILNDVDLPDAYRLGEIGSGLNIALGTLNRFRTSVAAAANGFSRRALDESVRHLESRNQFGKPLSAFQGLRFDIAEMDARLRASQLLTAEAADALDAGGDATAEVARAKLTATETASWICDRAVQHHGGLGVKRGVIVERLFREVRALRIYEGTSEIQKLILAKCVLERARNRNN